MNWIGLLFVIPLGAIYFLFFGNGRGYALVHSADQLYSSPELRFRYSADDLATYFTSVENQVELTRIWRWKYAATAVLLLVMAGIPFNFDMPLWLRIAMVVAAGLRALLAFIETTLLLSLQKKHLTQQTLTGAGLCSVLTSVKWCVSGLWVAGLFGFLMTRAWKMGK